MSTQCITVKTEDSFSIRCEYSPRCVSKFRGIAGTWSAPLWTWRNGAIKNAEKVCAELFGISDETVKIEIFAEQCDVVDNFLVLGGYVIASRRYRDMKATLGEFVDLVSGSLPSSGGSAKNPRVDAADDVLFEISVRKDFAERFAPVDIARNAAINRCRELTEEISGILNAHGLTLADLRD